jgi:hypothetical protein
MNSEILAKRLELANDLIPHKSAEQFRCSTTSSRIASDTHLRTKTQKKIPMASAGTMLTI